MRDEGPGREMEYGGRIGNGNALVHASRGLGVHGGQVLGRLAPWRSIKRERLQDKGRI